MKRLSKRLLIGGTLLFGTSAYPLARMAQEWSAGRELAAHYEFRPEYQAMILKIGGHSISVTDSFKDGAFAPEAMETAPVRISVDGKDLSDPSLVEIRPNYHDANRYHGWVVLAHLTNKKDGHEWIAVGERTLGDTLSTGSRASEPKTEFRLVMVDSKGEVKDERFRLSDRANPLYREVFVRFLYPQAIGLYSNALNFWPTVIYPILYPWLTAAVGLLMIFAGIGGRLVGAK